jgi:hypothetical protein
LEVLFSAEVIEVEVVAGEAVGPLAPAQNVVLRKRIQFFVFFFTGLMTNAYVHMQGDQRLACEKLARNVALHIFVKINA